MFECVNKNFSFSCFMAIFMRYCPQFWRSKGICMGIWPGTCLRVMTKTHCFRLYGHFHELLRTFFEFQGDLHVWQLWTKTRCFCILWLFSWVIAHSFGVLGRFTTIIRPDTCLRASPKTPHFRVLWAFLWGIAHSFGVLGRFTCLRIVTKNLSYLPFMAIFMSYCA